MIDARRWVLVEAWLALGLRIEWAPSYVRSERGSPEWIEGGGSRNTYRFRYSGGGMWQILDEDYGRRLAFAKPTAPQLCDDDLRHELAHYLSATPEQRKQVNFGITKDAEGDAREERALEAERVIDAMCEGANRIVLSAITPLTRPA